MSQPRRNIATRIGLLAMLAGCWRGTASSPPVEPAPVPSVEVSAPSGPTVAHSRARAWSSTRRGGGLRCDVVIEDAFERLAPELSSMQLTQVVIDEMQETLVTGCEELQWSVEALQCWNTMMSGNDLATCQRIMTPEQIEDMMQRLIAVQTRGYHVPPPPPSVHP